MHAHIKSPARTATTISSVCPKCGTIAKSGKTSCCSRGGSWFKTCGGAGNTRLQHTWYEGIQACKTQVQTWIAVAQQGRAAQQRDIDSSDGDDKVPFKGVITAAKPFVLSSANMSTSMAGKMSVILTANTSVSTSSAYAISTTYSKVIAGVGIAMISICF